MRFCIFLTFLPKIVKSTLFWHPLFWYLTVEVADINIKASSWLKACEILEAMANSRLSAIKAENKLKFWKNDTTHTKRENLFENADTTTDQGPEERPSKMNSVFKSLSSLFSRGKK